MEIFKQQNKIEMRHLTAPPTRDLNVWLCALDRFKRYGRKDRFKRYGRYISIYGYVGDKRFKRCGR